MITVEIQNRKEIIRTKAKIEKALNAKLFLKENILEVETDPLNEFEAQRVFDAMNLGFSADDALIILEEDISFVQLNMKDYANTKNLEVVRSRVIGTHGKTKLTIEEITKCKIKVQDNLIGIIGPGEIIETAITALTNIIKGTKQANAYRYLERINTQKREEKKGNNKTKIKL
jgi:KH domain-containing protein